MFDTCKLLFSLFRYAYVIILLISSWWNYIYYVFEQTTTSTNTTDSLNIRAFHHQNTSITTQPVLYNSTSVSSTEQLPIEKESGVDFYLVVYASSLAGILLLTILRGFAGATVSGIYVAIIFCKIFTCIILILRNSFFHTLFLNYFECFGI